MLSQLDQKVLRHWRNKLLTGRNKLLTGVKSGDRDQKRVAIVGNCQTFGVAYGMKFLNPALEVDRYAIVGRSWTGLKELVNILAGYDFIFAQDFGQGLLRDNGDGQALQAAMPGVRRLPSLDFHGFHPDTIYLFDPTRNGQLIQGPTAVYQSALALYGYLRGLSVTHTSALFEHDVFAYLGYLDVWESSAAALRHSGEAAGMDLSRPLARWARRGNFMYTPNHPKPHVMTDVARMLMLEAGLTVRDAELDDYLVDDLVRGCVLPVYPPLAELYGFRGSTYFKTEHYRLSLGPGEYLSLEAYIEKSFAVFARHKRAQLAHPRVDGWLDDAEITSALAQLSAKALRRKGAIVKKS